LICYSVVVDVCVDVIVLVVEYQLLLEFQHS